MVPPGERDGGVVTGGLWEVLHSGWTLKIRVMD